MQSVTQNQRCVRYRVEGAMRCQDKIAKPDEGYAARVACVEASLLPGVRPYVAAIRELLNV